jgi:hypothetical protein
MAASLQILLSLAQKPEQVDATTVEGKADVPPICRVRQPVTHK